MREGQKTREGRVRLGRGEGREGGERQRRKVRKEEGRDKKF